MVERFTVVPRAASRAWLDTVACHVTRTPPPTVAVLGKGAHYSAKTGTWRLAIVVSAPGRLSYRQRSPRTRLVQGGTLTVATPGSVTITLRPTAAARADLRRRREVAVDLDVVLTPRAGAAVTKHVRLILHR